MPLPPEDVEKQVYADALRKSAHDYEELLREFSVLRMLNESIQVGLGFNEICRKLVDFVTEMMNVENASIMVLDRERQELRLLAAKSILDEECAVYDAEHWSGKTFKVGEGIAGEAVRNGKSILINDITTDERFIPHEGQKVQVRSILCIPLIHENRIHGVLNISNSSANAFTQRKEHALTVIASTASVALSYALTVDELTRVNLELKNRNKELGAVIELSELLHPNVESNLVFEESMQTIMHTFDVDGAAVFLIEGDPARAELKTYRSRDSRDLRKVFLTLNEKCGAQIAESKSLFVQSFRRDEIVKEENAIPSHMRLIGLPLLSGEHCIGAVMTFSFDGWGPTGTEAKLLKTFCSQIAMAIHNAKLIKHLRENIEELQDARQKLIQADKLALLGEMLSGVAHEINNPLAAIHGYTELLLNESSLSANQIRMLGKIVLSVDRTRKIVQGLLSFARKTELKKRPARLHELISRAVQHREHDFVLGNIEIVRILEKPEPIVLVDPNQIEQVFLNLINNAFDSMAEKGNGKLLISTSCRDNSAVRIEFVDTGIGIPEKSRKKIFEPFYTTKEAGKGTGLGLSISYGIIKEHGGDLFVEDQYQDGANLVVVLPLAKQESRNEFPEARDEGSNFRSQKNSVLLIDDEEVVLDFLEATLSSDGFSVDLASNGQSALKLLKEKSFDLVISDIRMPGSLDGRNLFLLCKEMLPHMTDRFIFVTGDVIEPNTANFLEQCGRPFLLKPFSLSDLRQTVNEALRKAPQRARS